MTESIAAQAAQPAAAVRPKTGRRLDVEGLRGVAIMLVVVFHIWMGTVSGGVDAFLFISGFFLIPSLLRSQTGSDPVGNPLPRLWRVLKRLWIPMALVVAVTVAAVWWVYPYTRRAETLVGALWSDLFVENWALGLAGNSYVDATSLPSPFQHLWSLAVQAQIFAVLIGGITLLGLLLRVLVRRGRLRSDTVGRILVGLLIVGTVASFGWATLVGPANQTLNYYSTFARFWEIALGGLVALVITRVHLPTWARQLAGVAGLTMLAITGLVLDGAATFPGPAALLPLGGTALIFVAGTTGGSTVTRALASRPIVYLGSIAYPLYLWHWPLLVLFLVYRNFRGAAVTQVSLVDGLAIIAVSLVLAAATDFLLKADSPVRRLRIRVPVILAATAAALTVAITAWLAPIPQVSAEDLDPALYPGAAAAAGAPVPRGVEFAPRAEAARMDLPQSGFDDCVAYYDREGPVDVVSCDYGAPRAPGRKVLAMVGGSHVDHFLPAIDLIGKEQGFTVELVVMVGCSLGYGPAAATSHDSERCVQWQAKAMDHIVDTRPDAVFTNSTRPAKPFGTGDHVPQWYVDAFTRLSDAGIPVVGIRDLPWLMTADGQAIEPFDCMAVRDDAVACGVSRDWSLAPVDPAIEALGSLPGVSLIDASDQYCGPEECPVVVGNVLVYRDAHHFTKTFVLSMRPFLERELSRALGWFQAFGPH